jgi:hypothetical protein
MVRATAAPPGNAAPSQSLIQRKERQTSRLPYLDEHEMVGRLNRRLRGSKNYFQLGIVSPALAR